MLDSSLVVVFTALSALITIYYIHSKADKHEHAAQTQPPTLEAFEIPVNFIPSNLE
jgi:hypothetical protein